MVLTNREKLKLLKLKKIAKGSKIKVTRTGNIGRVRFKGNGRNITRRISDNVSPVSPERQLKAMVTLSKIKKRIMFLKKK